MIRVSALREFMRPRDVEHEFHEWGIDSTARRLAPEWWNPEAPGAIAARNGAPLADLDAILADGDHVFFYTRPSITVVAPLAVPGFLLTLANTAQLLLASALISKLLLPKAKPTQPGEETSPTYAFTNLQKNQRAEGIPVPVIYGRHRVAGPIINQYVRTSLDDQGNPISEYLALILLSEGPIQSIGGKTEDGGPFRSDDGTYLPTLQINNQPAENLEGVEAHVRLGTDEQSVIDEFAQPVLQFSIEQTLRESETLTPANTPTDSPSSTTAIANAGAFASSNVNVTKWDRFVSYTMGDEADEFTLLISFPQGLGDFQGITPDELSFLYQVRYQQVDDLGIPFGDVIVLNAAEVFVARQGLFQIEYRRRFFSTVGYQPPQNGFFLRGRTGNNGTTNRGATYTVNATAVPATSLDDTRFSFAAWIRPNGTLPQSPDAFFNARRRIFSWFGANKGIAVDVSRDSNATGAALIISIGNGSTTVATTFLNPVSSANAVNNAFCIDTGPTQQLAHLAIVYVGDRKGPGNAVIDVYINGVKRYSKDVPQMLLDPTQPIRVATDSATAPALGFNCDIDEVLFYNKELSSYDVSRLFGSYAPIEVADDEPGLLVGFHFEGSFVDGGLIYSAAFGPAVSAAPGIQLGNGLGGTTPNANPETSNNPTSELGVVKIAEQGIHVRGKFRVDVMRLSAEDTEFGLVSEAVVSNIQLRLFEQYSYPGLALLAVKVKATDQINGTSPLITVIAEGRLLPTWDGNDALHPNTPELFSRNPAWMALDAATNKLYGLGNLYTISDADIAALRSLAIWCDTLRPDNGARQRLIDARQIDAADTGNLPTALQGGSQDFVRFRMAALPSNFVQPTSGMVETGRYASCRIFGTPSPSVPTWLSDEIAAGPQQIVYVEFVSSINGFYFWCESSAAVGSTSALYTPGISTSNYLDVEMHAPRVTYDGVFDRIGVSAWDAIIQILQVARATPVRVGSRLSVFHDDVASPVALVGMGNIIEGSWRTSYQDNKSRWNAESAEFLDEDLNYERSFDQDEHPSVTDPTRQSSYNWRRVKLEGIVRRGQLKRHLRRDLNAFFLLRRMVSFELGLDALPFQPGDVIAVAHDVPGYGISGRLLNDSADTSTFKLDRPVTLDSGKTYQIQIENAGTGQRQTRTISTAAGTYAAGATLTVSSAFGFVPDQFDKYALGEQTIGPFKLFRVVESILDPETLRRSVKALEYDEQVFDDDFGELPEVAPTLLPAPSAPTIPGGVENLAVDESSTRGPDGVVRVEAVLSFNHPASTYHAVGGVDVYIGSSRDSAEPVARIPADVTRVRVGYPFERGRTYTLWVVPRSKDGSSAYRAYASFVRFTPSGLAKPPATPTAASAVMSGKSITYGWSISDEHAGTIEGRRGGWILGAPVFTVPSSVRSATVPNWAGGPANASGVSTADVYIRARLPNGQYSESFAVLQLDPEPVETRVKVLEISEEDEVWGTDPA